MVAQSSWDRENAGCHTVDQPSHRAGCGQDPLIDRLGGPDKVADVQSLGSSPRGAQATAPVIKAESTPSCLCQADVLQAR